MPSEELKHAYFNSCVVRLKVASVFGLVQDVVEFQFLCGAIEGQLVKQGLAD